MPSKGICEPMSAPRVGGRAGVCAREFICVCVYVCAFVCVRVHLLGHSWAILGILCRWR